MKKILLKISAQIAALLIQALLDQLKDKKTEMYEVVANNFCDVLLSQMARDVEKRNRQLEESVERVRSEREKKGV